MPEWTTYNLEMSGALHVGQRGVGREETAAYLPSDTLFAALMAASLESGDEEGRWTEAFGPGRPGGPPFLLTSAFPRAGRVRFYPLPQVDLAPLGIDTDAERKTLRRIDFCSEGIVRRIAAGQPLGGCLPLLGRDPEEGLFLQGARCGCCARRWRGCPRPCALVQAARANRKRARWSTFRCGTLPARRG